MNQTQRDLINLFFRRDTLRERIYPTRVTYLAITLTVMLGLAFLFVGAARFHEGLGLPALRPTSLAETAHTPPPTAATPSAPPAAAARSSTVTPPAAPPQNSPAARPSDGSALPPAKAPRCPVTWKVERIVLTSGEVRGTVNDDEVVRQVNRNYYEAMQWAGSPSWPWNMDAVEQYYTPPMANEIRDNVQLSRVQGEYASSTASGWGITSLSFTPDGAGVTFLAAQDEPITQTIRDLSTQGIKRTVVLNDVPYIFLGVSMRYDTEECRWKIHEIDYPTPVKTP